MFGHAYLDRVPPGDHLVQFYETHEGLVAAIARYVSGALAANEAVLLILPDERRAPLFAQLGISARARDRRIATGQLTLLDSVEMLAAFDLDGGADGGRIATLLDRHLDAVPRGFSGVRVYGEMVDVFWRAGRLDDALRLEAFWDDQVKRRRIALLCAYFLDVLERENHLGPIQRLCKVHSHLIPEHDYPRLERAVAEAIDQVLGPEQAGVLRAMTAFQQGETITPEAQTQLLWLRDVTPGAADKVLEQARLNYGAPS